MKTNSRVMVVGVDFGPCGDDAILEGLEQLASGAAHIMHVAYAIDPRDVVGHPDKRALEVEEEILARTPSLLHRRVREVAALHGLHNDPAQLRAHVRLGRAADTLLQICVDYDADLLIVGTHGRHGVNRVLVGSVAEALVRTSRCPVLVARPKNYLGLTRTALPDRPYAPGEEPPRKRQSDAAEHVTSTTMDGWRPSDGGPTGFRIV